MRVRRWTSLSGIGLEGFRLDLDLGEIDQLHAELLGEGGEDVLFLGEVAFDDEFVQRLRRRQGVGLSDTGQVVRLEDAAADKTLRKLHSGLGFGYLSGKSEEVRAPEGINPP